ncbi:MAG: efflux RND transporter periplasmic adaptor subunit, partial [Planctomycetota bacterium]
FGWLLFLGILGLLLWLFREPLLSNYERLTLPTVKTAQVKLRSTRSKVVARGTASNGYVVARTRAALSADTPGRIVELRVEEGSIVEEGELVARLFDDEFRAAVQRAEADLRLSEAALQKTVSQKEARESEVARLRVNVTVAEANLTEAKALLNLAETNLTRFERLVQEGVETVLRRDEVRQEFDARAARVASLEASKASSDAGVLEGERRLDIAVAEVLEAEARIEVMQATLEQAKATLDKTEVRAPFKGIVVLKDAEVGEVVSPNSQGGSSRGSVVTMVDFASLEVQADVPETSLAAVTVGAPAKIFLDAFPEEPYPGRVTRIWPTADKQTATVEVRVAFETLDERLRPEMGVRVVFLEGEQPDAPEPEDEEPVLLLPENCLVARESKQVAFVVKGGVLERREVRTGETVSGRVVVESGLQEGERVVVEPGPRLEDGQRVKVED